MKTRYIKALYRIKFIPVFFLFYHSYSCAVEPLKIGVISDIHYLSEQFTDNGKAANNYYISTGKNVIEIPAILDRVLEEYITSDINILLIPGDLTKDGEKQSHLDLAEKFQILTRHGIRIFVIPGNHDINIPKPLRYEGNETYPIENISPEDFINIYSDFGYNSSLKRDYSSLSYLAEIKSDIWLLAIDASRYKEYKDKSISSGKILPETEEWILSILDEAKEKNIKVISMMHHGLVEHLPFQNMFFPQYLVDDWQRLAELFADKGMRFIFTGHFHANDITGFTSTEGNTVYDIETGSLSAFPYPYRLIEITSDTISISTKNVISIPQNPNLYEDGRQFLKNVGYKSAAQKISGKKKNLSESHLSGLAEIASELFILHVQGDEIINTDLQNKIRIIGEDMDLPVDLSPEFFELDFPPADNNVKLSF